MQLDEVPADMHAARCHTCHDYLAVPADLKAGSGDYIEFIRAHHALCPGIPQPCQCPRCGEPEATDG